MKPTRITPRSQTLIDNIFYNEIQPNVMSGNITTDISDHLTQFLIIPGKWHADNSNEDVYRRNYKTLNHNKFKEDFNKTDWNTLDAVNNIDVAYDIFLEKADELIDKHIPEEKISKRKMKQQKRKPWISNDLLRQINYKNNLHKKSQTEKDLNRRNDLINEVKVLQNSLKKKTQIAKDNYYQKFFKENKNDLIKVWKNIKNLINFKSKAKHNNIKSLYIDKGKVTSDPTEICNNFNNHFTTIAGKIDKKIVKTRRNFRSYLINQNEKTFSLYPTTPKEV